MQNALFICPICQSPLKAGEKIWICDASSAENAKHHSFDMAKQGYINLLPVQFKKSKNPGDSEASITARQQFLQQGYYEVLIQGLLDFVKNDLKMDKTIWLDVGCGDGYYTEHFLSLHPQHLVAMDISKSAVIATAKRLKNRQNVTCFVATAAQMPLQPGSVNVITSIFSPILPDEFARLLAENGIVIIAKPSPTHLIQLRQALFESVESHDSDKFIEQMAPHFNLHSQALIENEITVDSAALADLMTMTPYAYRASPARRQAILDQCQRLGSLTLTLGFVIYGFIKK